MFYNSKSMLVSAVIPRIIPAKLVTYCFAKLYRHIRLRLNTHTHTHTNIHKHIHTDQTHAYAYSLKTHTHTNIHTDQTHTYTYPLKTHTHIHTQTRTHRPNTQIRFCHSTHGRYIAMTCCNVKFYNMVCSMLWHRKLLIVHTVVFSKWLAKSKLLKNRNEWCCCIIIILWMLLSVFLQRYLMLMMLMILTRVFNANNDHEDYRHKKCWWN